MEVFMWFWWFMLACDMLIPVLMIGFGILMLKKPPKDINSLFGYRTALSMKNMDTWRFAHDYAGRLWRKIGLIMAVPSIVVHIPFYNASEDAVGVLGIIVTTIQCVVLVASIFPVESALGKTFNRDGTRKEE